jgi:DNA modification methylase
MLNKRPLIVFTDVDGKYCVLGGNMRLKALNELKYTEIPIIIADEWTEEQKAEFLIKDNVGFGEWDWDQLANEWDAEKLDDWGLDLPIDLSVTELEAEEDDFAVPEGGIETDIVIGDLFEIGEHRLLCGDSTDSDQVAKLMNGSKADMVFTSPPYNGNTHLDIGKGGGRLYNDKEMDNKESDVYIDFLQQVLNNILINTNGFIFWNINYNAKSRNEYLKHLVPYFDYLWETIIWEKTGMPIADGLTRNCEFIFVLKNGERKHLGKHFETSHNLWKISNLNSQDLKNNHRACFPIELPSKGINLGSEINNVILEPFTGSGSTMIASHQLKRKCYGMELDPKYCQVIIDRMKKLDSSLVIKRNGITM